MILWRGDKVTFSKTVLLINSTVEFLCYGNRERLHSHIVEGEEISSYHVQSCSQDINGTSESYMNLKTAFTVFIF